ncbi:MAG: hypothetical protein HYZ53_03135 [Planctomycetes bacterium]|nr:hypothetical protein [Planctomycetota bacterium]
MNPGDGRRDVGRLLGLLGGVLLAAAWFLPIHVGYFWPLTPSALSELAPGHLGAGFRRVGDPPPGFLLSLALRTIFHVPHFFGLVVALRAAAELFSHASAVRWSRQAVLLSHGVGILAVALCLWAWPWPDERHAGLDIGYHLERVYLVLAWSGIGGTAVLSLRSRLRPVAEETQILACQTLGAAMVFLWFQLFLLDSGPRDFSAVASRPLPGVWMGLTGSLLTLLGGAVEGLAPLRKGGLR